ncbi:UrcA family protein [Parvularcula oceani]|uniref:UrcA family protein n=1 Tax=Parvularcula oceani TaxID=1247963 RepID=UPI0004E0E272|nr:UrcA family protein [Parvularcula oceani]
MIRTSLAVFGTAAVLFLQPAVAQEVSVEISAVELASKEGAAKVYRKLEKRAARACGVEERLSPAERNARKACAADLLEQFVASADHSMLTAAHERPVRFAEAR